MPAALRDYSCWLLAYWASGETLHCSLYTTFTCCSTDSIDEVPGLGSVYKTIKK